MLYAYDNDSFEKVAEDLQVLNPGYSKPVPEQIEYMKAMGRQYAAENKEQPGYIGTGGFYVIWVVQDKGDQKQLYFKALLMGGMVGDKLKKADAAIAKLEKVKGIVNE